jgi:hypothetical protein
MRKPTLLLALLAAAELTLTSCGLTDPYATRSKITQSATTAAAPPPTAAAPEQNPGEPPVPPPASPAAQTPDHLSASPRTAVAQFAALYVNWSWRTLTAQQRELAGISVGSARLAEQQAASASSRDSEISRARVYNRGQVITIAPSRTHPSQWVVVTREQTGGDSQYDGLQASYHVTIAQVVQVPGRGYAISQWLPQN